MAAIPAEGERPRKKKCVETVAKIRTFAVYYCNTFGVYFTSFVGNGKLELDRTDQIFDNQGVEII